jgi:hypothetical protein
MLFLCSLSAAIIFFCANNRQLIGKWQVNTTNQKNLLSIYCLTFFKKLSPSEISTDALDTEQGQICDVPSLHKTR